MSARAERRAKPTARSGALDPAARWALSIGLALQGPTLAWIAFRNGTSVDGFLFVQRGWPEAHARWVDLAVAALAAGGALALVRGLRRSAAVLVASAALAVAVADTLVGGQAFSDWSVPAAALRWLAPLALLGVRSEAVLRVAIAATFLAHGREALGHHPLFVDLAIGALRRVSLSAPSEASVAVGLTVIGSIDVAIAALLLVARWPALAAWATVWGTATAAARTMALGPEFVDQTLLRALHGLGPLALWLCWRRRDPPPTKGAP